jgi:hypothetical protein
LSFLLPLKTLTEAGSSFLISPGTLFHPEEQVKAKRELTRILLSEVLPAACSGIEQELV